MCVWLVIYITLSVVSVRYVCVLSEFGSIRAAVFFLILEAFVFYFRHVNMLWIQIFVICVFQCNIINSFSKLQVKSVLISVLWFNVLFINYLKLLFYLFMFEGAIVLLLLLLCSIYKCWTIPILFIFFFFYSFMICFFNFIYLNNKIYFFS